MAGYGSDQGFTDYATGAGYTVPAGNVAAARQRGSAYVDGAYGLRFPGWPAGGYAQERAWPRVGATDYFGNAVPANIVPAAVVNASYEAALLELQSPGSLSVVASDAERVKSLKAGSAQIEYADSSSSSAVEAATPASTLIEGMLAPLLVARNIPGAMVV